ncbi:MAG: crossover junction endodeoxyribonuclease RuvC [Bacteroidales bacterium]|nr:MAG: crossover junction endodeoxyribonuclease RuvC [Bacteroidales bacterium]
MSKERIILGIDPGTNIMGYGIIKVTGSLPSLVCLGIIELKKYNDHYIKLKKLFDRTIQLIDQYHPDELAIEAPFYGRNVQSMLLLGRAQGVAISAGLNRSIPIFEYAPRKIKLAITGHGNASKEQVAALLQSIFKIDSIPKNLDATDGLAVALCHFYQKNLSQSSNSYKSWNEFIRKNPGRIK